MQRVREKANPRPLGYVVSTIPAGPSLGEALPEEPFSFAKPDGGMAGDFIGDKHARSEVRKDRKSANRGRRGGLGRRQT